VTRSGRTSHRRRRALALLAGLAALGGVAAGRAAMSDDRPAAIPDLACLRKLSLDLTARGPSDDAVARLTSGDATLDDLADEYLASPEFADVAFDWMRQEFPATNLTTAETDIEEPARLMRHILLADRDWREILTATYTVDEAGAEHPITDRPAAGILSTRYLLSSSVGSLRRNWAGRFERQFAGIVLVAVTLPPGDETDTSRDGLAGNPACAGCHVHPTYGIDSLARFADCYDPAGERIAGCADPEASFLLETGRGLPDLGRITATTNEFKSQSVDFFFKRLFGRDLARQEAAFYGAAARAFTDSGYKAREVVRFLVTSPEYCAR
jgi:hypothetical protein